MNRGIALREAGRGDEAAALLAEARRRTTAVGDRLALGRCVCEEGHLALDRGESPERALAEASAIAEEVGLRRGLLQAEIDRLAARREGRASASGT